MRGLALVLRVSAAYDLIAAALLLWMPGWLLDLWHHPRPAEPFLFRLSALPLLLLPPIYLAAAAAPARRPELVRLSVLLRVLGGVAIALLLAWQRPPAPGPYLLFAVVDVLWAGAYVGAGRMARRAGSAVVLVTMAWAAGARPAHAVAWIGVRFDSQAATTSASARPGDDASTPNALRTIRQAAA